MVEKPVAEVSISAGGMGDDDINASYEDKPVQINENSTEALNATAPVDTAVEEARKVAEEASKEMNRINA